MQAIESLGKRYKLVPLSNVDHASFDQILAGPLLGCHFDQIYTAEDIGTYKPDVKKFHYLLENVKADLEWRNMIFVMWHNRIFTIMVLHGKLACRAFGWTGVDSWEVILQVRRRNMASDFVCRLCKSWLRLLRRHGGRTDAFGIAWGISI